MINSFNIIPKKFVVKWQNIADLLAKIINVPAALIMKTENEFMEVFISSNSEKTRITPAIKSIGTDYIAKLLLNRKMNCLFLMLSKTKIGIKTPILKWV